MSITEFRVAKGKRPYPLSMIANNLIVAMIFMGAPIYFGLSNSLFRIDLIGLILLVPILIGLILALSGVQRLIGAKMYRVDSSSLVVTHGFGSTRIPFREIKEVSRSRLRSYTEKHRTTHTTKGKTTTSTTTDVHYVDPQGTGLKISGAVLPFCSPLYISAGEGDCVLLKMDKKAPIALTPENVDEMLKAVSDRVTPMG